MALPSAESIGLWLLCAFLKVLYGLLSLLPQRNSGRPQKLPSTSNPLLKLSATQLAKKIRKREVSSVEVVQAYIDRVQEVNPLLNAVVKDRFSAALLEAAQVDKLIEDEQDGDEALEDRLPLLGVPFTVKESFALQGMPNSTGLLSRARVIAMADAPPVALLKRAGAIPLGVTNCPELCMWLESHNHLYGITNNPYDLQRIAGGSSGGEGSIIGAGASLMGTGSDIGGSIRLPCFFCGIFGHKTTPGIISNDAQFPPASGRHEEYQSTGPMCRYAEDLLPMLEIMAGPNAHKLCLSKEVDLRKLRYFTVPHDGGSPLTSPVDKQLSQAQRKMVERLQADLGVTVEEVHFPQLKHAYQIWNTYLGLPDQDGKPPQSFVELMEDGGPAVWPLWELFKSMMGRSSHTLAVIAFALLGSANSKPSEFILQQKEALQQEVEELLGTDGVLFYPTYPQIAPKHHQPLFTPFNFAYTGILNILGLPVTQCPLGLSEDGLPLGLQVAAGKRLDRLPLAVARYLETAFGGWRDPGAC